MFTKVDHVAFVVEDIEAWTERVESVYGLELAGTNAEEHRERYDVLAAFFEVGGSVLELMQPTSEEGWTAERLREGGEGFFHIAYAVDDVEAAMAALRKAGVGLEDDEPRPGFSGRLVTLDPADTLVPTQIVEPE